MFQARSQAWYSSVAGRHSERVANPIDSFGQCLKSDRGARIDNGFLAQTRRSQEPIRRLRAREASRRGGPRTDSRRTHARPRGPWQSSARVPRSLLPGREQRDRYEQGPSAPDPGDEPGAVQALRVLRPPPRIPALPRVHRRTRLPRGIASDPRDALRREPRRHADFRGHDPVLPEPRLPGRRVAAGRVEPRVRTRLRSRRGLVHRVMGPAWTGVDRQRNYKYGPSIRRARRREVAIEAWRK